MPGAAAGRYRAGRGSGRAAARGGLRRTAWESFRAGLGLLPGSYCPHYDAEPLRRPAFTSLVADGTLAAGIACDDGAGAHFTGGTLTGIVSGLPGARGYRVTPGGPGGVTEAPLPDSPLAG